MKKLPRYLVLPSVIIVVIALLVILYVIRHEVLSVDLPNSCTLEPCSRETHIIVQWDGDQSKILVAGSVQSYAVVGGIVFGRIPEPAPHRKITEPIGYFLLNTKNGDRQMGLTYEEMVQLGNDMYGIDSIPPMKETFSLKVKE